MMAPTFSLPDQDGVVRSLADYAGSWLVLYFYPKDDTPGCTTEACTLRDSLSALQKLGAAVVGVSKDSVKSHKKFAEKFELNFPLLSDESGETVEAYGAWGGKKLWGREYDGILRKTFIINPEGEIAKEYPEVNPTQHAAELIEDLEKLVG